MAGATPCPRPQTAFLESTRLGLPDGRPLRPPTSFTNLRGLPAARFPVPARPPASASQGVVGSTRRRSPNSTALVPTPPPQTRVRTPRSRGHPGSCSPSEEGATRRSPGIFYLVDVERGCEYQDLTPARGNVLYLGPFGSYKQKLTAH